MSKTWEIVLAGEGGQGLIVMGRLLAQAAILEGKNVVQTQSYGIASRGGYSEAEVLLSDGDIYHPKCANPDFVLALTQQAYDRYSGKVAQDCIIVYEQDSVIPKRGINEYGYRLYDTALDLGNEKTLNVLALGVVLKHLAVVEKDSMVQTLMAYFPPKLHELNLRALETGIKMD